MIFSYPENACKQSAAEFTMNHPIGGCSLHMSLKDDQVPEYTLGSISSATILCRRKEKKKARMEEQRRQAIMAEQIALSMAMQNMLPSK